MNNSKMLLKDCSDFLDIIAFLGINNINQLDSYTKNNISNLIIDLDKNGFSKISYFLKKLIEEKNIKDYTFLKIILNEMEFSILKNI